jgi:hypothetical protein
MSWCRAQIWDIWPEFFFFKGPGLFFGAPTLTIGRVCHVSGLVIEVYHTPALCYPDNVNLLDMRWDSFAWDTNCLHSTLSQLPSPCLRHRSASHVLWLVVLVVSDAHRRWLCEDDGLPVFPDLHVGHLLYVRLQLDGSGEYGTSVLRDFWDLTPCDME